ncbi:MAG: helix-turn-helix transcriptional regulator [Clostridia bacterium]|nr:helix-turn-helix transcriptional regulator [Clostridia bacterium]
MASIVYERIKRLCAKKGITIAKLESDLGFGNASIKKWEKMSSPSIDKVVKVATYFDVSIDYLMGRSDIEISMSELVGDEDIISFQRARERMSPKDREKMMAMLKLGFEYAFSDEEDT